MMINKVEFDDVMILDGIKEELQGFLETKEIEKVIEVVKDSLGLL